MDISSIQPVVHPFYWLQGEVADLGQTGGGIKRLLKKPAGCERMEQRH